ncbi:uncharacterized protein BCR38DRAFT_172356 [Pseudomassariella vexata]|uniref:Uncharacterized protein n=1 Tax=Pseudomassariella vexata TaxID=1141098 RepID=A0A1Y2E3C7_9PEZI|nr:uncharacterized protein BCR38DRAFT_172356 [Pseudomassariella vexata]ORY66058.1 hypothetical protein BCR38DRAFT_172356 [Pseudomassariella vexata]
MSSMKQILLSMNPTKIFSTLRSMSAARTPTPTTKQPPIILWSSIDNHWMPRGRAQPHPPEQTPPRTLETHPLIDPDEHLTLGFRFQDQKQREYARVLETRLQGLKWGARLPFLYWRHKVMAKQLEDITAQQKRYAPFDEHLQVAKTRTEWRREVLEARIFKEVSPQGKVGAEIERQRAMKEAELDRVLCILAQRSDREAPIAAKPFEEIREEERRGIFTKPWKWSGYMP